MRRIDLNNTQAATKETVREINGRAMLNLVRKHHPISRADLMRHSGLQRSPGSVITGQLVSDRRLKEAPVGHSPRGRRPTFLYLNGDRCGAAGVDVQPDVTRVAAANMDNRFLAQESMPLGWSEVNSKSLLERNLGLPVTRENAANACALAELCARRHLKGGHSLVVVTGLAPHILVVAGEVTRAWSRVSPIVVHAVKRHAPADAAARIVSADPESQLQLQRCRGPGFPKTC